MAFALSFSSRNAEGSRGVATQPYQIHPHWQRTESHSRTLRKSDLQTAQDLIHIGSSHGPAQATLCPRLQNLSIEAGPSPKVLGPVLSYPDPSKWLPSGVPCPLLPARTCTTSLHKEIRSRRPSLFPPVQHCAVSVVMPHCNTGSTI